MNFPISERVYERRNQQLLQPQGALLEATQVTLDKHTAIMREILEQLGLLLRGQSIYQERTHLERMGHGSHRDDDGNGSGIGCESEKIKFSQPMIPKARQQRDPHGF